MKNYLVFVVLFFGCKATTNHQLDCSDISFDRVYLYQPDSISINFPTTWTIKDTTQWKGNKRLLHTESRFSKDSANKAFFNVYDFTFDSSIHPDINALQEDLEIERHDLFNNDDSIVVVRSLTSLGWNISQVLSFRKSDLKEVIGQVACAKEGKHVQLLFHVKQNTFSESKRIGQYILSSISVGKSRPFENSD